MNSLRAFADAATLFSKDITNVSRAGTANSVWLCSTDEGPKFVIKYFQNNAHGQIHFESERQFLEINRYSFLPNILYSNKEHYSITSEYVFEDLNSKVTLLALVNDLKYSFPLLEIPFQAHSEPPGILSWDESHFLDSVAQRMAMNVIQGTEWFKPYKRILNESWLPEVAVHGDLKLSNILLSTNQAIYIDWENVSKGPRFWDLSGLLQSILSEIVARGRNRFWAIANLETCLHLISELDDLTRMAVCLRTIQSAIEYSTNSSQIPIHAVNMLQIAEFIAEKKYPEVKKLREYV